MHLKERFIKIYKSKLTSWIDQGRMLYLIAIVIAWQCFAL